MSNSSDFHCPYPVGSIIADKYRVEKVLGKGGMGIVLAARHIKLDEAVAIKLMLQDDLFNQHSVERFLREARACVKLKNNEHIARVSDVDTLSSGLPYMVMELLDGYDLDKLLKERGVLQIHDACSYLIQACRALDEAHRLGIIHRDLKPQNLFLTRRRDGSTCLKVLDFGISKHTLADESVSIDLTRPTDVLGSLYYMSPEQARSSRKVVPQSDIYSLGAVLYKLLTGRAPFPKKAVLDAYEALFNEAPPPPSKIRKEIPPKLESIILCCLDKQVDRRYANVAELMRALTPFTVPRDLPVVDDRDSDTVTTHPRGAAPRVVSLHGTEPLGQVIPAQIQKQMKVTPSRAADQDSPAEHGSAFKTQKLDARSLHDALHNYLPPKAIARSPAALQPRVDLQAAEKSTDKTTRMPSHSRTNPTPVRDEPGPRKPMDSAHAIDARNPPAPRSTETPLPAPIIGKGTMYVSSTTHLINAPAVGSATIQPGSSHKDSRIPWNSFPAAPERIKTRRKRLAVVAGTIATLVLLIVVKLLT